ncbi:MAG: DUF3105 domain-containing protein [Kofleriaceae bacterium]
MRSWLLLPLLAACGEDVGPRPLHFELGICGVVDIFPEDPGAHAPQGSFIEWSTNPPTSGTHFPIWAQYDRTYGVLDRGFWVHNLEHGAIVLAHRCEDCPAEVAMLEDSIRAMPVDSACVAPVRQRAIIVTDPLLPIETPFAAIAWGSVYTSTCIDPQAIAQFTSDSYGSAPEDICNDGASLGGVPITPPLE